MDAKIVYTLDRLPHPFNRKQREGGAYAWCLVKRVRPLVGRETKEPIAIFDFDSEAETFAGHIIATGLDGKLVKVDRDLAALLRQKLGEEIKP